MINKDRIVPITEIDLLTAYGTMLKIGGVSVTTIDAKNPGVFDITSGGTLLADEPVESADFAESVSSAVVYFVPAFNYKGFKINGEAVEATGTVIADGATLYKATLATSEITIEKAGM